MTCPARPDPELRARAAALAATLEPRSLAPFTRILIGRIGLEAVCALSAAWGGLERVLPVTADGSAELNTLLTAEERRRLVAQWGGQRIYLPRLAAAAAVARAQAVRAARAGGESSAKVARRLGLTRRRVMQISRAQAVPEPQHSLPLPEPSP